MGPPGKQIQRIHRLLTRIVTHNHDGTGDGGATVDHGNLDGLTDDDHTQYLLADGSRAMTGDLDLDSNDLTNPGAGHDSFSDFVADEHVAHAGVTITAGSGLSGGGTIATSRTIDVDISELTANSTPDEGADLVMIHDAGAGAPQKMVLSDLPHLLRSGGNLTGNVTADAGITVDGVDIGANIAAYVAGSLRTDVTICGGATTITAASSKAVTLPVTYASGNSYLAFAMVLGTSTTPYVTAVNRDSDSQITIYLSASGTVGVGWYTMGF